MMSGARQLAMWGLAAGCLAGCLDSPPAALSSGDGSVGDGDGSVGGDIDADVVCSTILRNQFDDDSAWEPYAEEGTSVDVESDQVHILISANSAESYADIATLTTGPIDRSELVASLSVAARTTGVAGISWYDEDNDDYYDLEVNSGVVEAIEKAASSSDETLLCSPCLPYDPTAHARMRLLAAAGTVHFQVAPEQGQWLEVASTPVRQGDYTRSAFGWADVDQEAESTVSEMIWLECPL